MKPSDKSTLDKSQFHFRFRHSPCEAGDVCARAWGGMSVEFNWGWIDSSEGSTGAKTRIQLNMQKNCVPQHVIQRSECTTQGWGSSICTFSSTGKHYFFVSQLCPDCSLVYFSISYKQRENCLSICIAATCGSRNRAQSHGSSDTGVHACAHTRARESAW